MSTIDAALVADSVGLPAVWRPAGDPAHVAIARDYNGATFVAGLNPDADPGWEIWYETTPLHVDLSDPQTAFGVALRLDAWERFARATHIEKPFGDSDIGAGYEGKRWAWTVELHAHQSERTARGAMVLQALIARLTRIAYDHRIRRALGDVVEPGTLGEPSRHETEEGWAWLFMGPGAGRVGVWALCGRGHAGITDPAEALKAIHDEVRGE